MIRLQLSLYVAEPEARALEALRARLDPVQQSLIPAHVTLARDRDIDMRACADWRERVADLREASLQLRFGAPEAFHEHGILMRCTEGAGSFDALRRRLLGPGALPVAAHITLAHPRNPKAPGNSLATALAELPAPLALRFDSLNLIEQRDGGCWQVLARAALA